MRFDASRKHRFLIPFQTALTVVLLELLIDDAQSFTETAIIMKLGNEVNVVTVGLVYDLMQPDDVWVLELLEHF